MSTNTTVTAEDVKMYKNINAASYGISIPALIIWLLVFARIFYHKIYMWLIIMICTLMVLFWISLMFVF